MRLLAFCTAVDCAASRATREVRSSWSVEMGVLEAWELNERELDEGDKRPVPLLLWLIVLVLVFRGCANAVTPFPLPITLPPPKVLRAAMS